MQFKADYSQLMRLMDQILKWSRRDTRKINIYVASGIRHDLVLLNLDYIDLLARYFVGGHLKVLPQDPVRRSSNLWANPESRCSRNLSEDLKMLREKQARSSILSLIL